MIGLMKNFIKEKPSCGWFHIMILILKINPHVETSKQLDLVCEFALKCQCSWKF